MPAIRISRFRLSSLKRILEIETASFGRAAYPEELFLELFEQCPALFLTAKYGLRIAGYMITCTRGDTAEVVSLAVHPDYRRLGLATALMRYTLRALARSRIARVKLMVRRDNPAAISFYAGFGFRRVRTVPGYYEDGAAGLLMRKQI